MKIAVAVPQQICDPQALRDYLQRAEDANVSYALFFDHLWQVGEPGTNSLEVMTACGFALGATTKLSIGSLVTRVGLRSLSETLSALLGLYRISNGRFLPGLGVGDKLSKPEEQAYGVFTELSERKRQLNELLEILLQKNIPVLIGGKSLVSGLNPKFNSIVLANYWDLQPEELGLVANSDLKLTVASSIPKNYRGDFKKVLNWALAYREKKVEILIISWPSDFSLLKALIEQISE